MSTSDKFYKDIELELTALKRVKLDLCNEIESVKHDQDTLLDSIFIDLISVVDSYEKAYNKVEEKFNGDESALRTRKLFATSLKKLLCVFEKYGVSEIKFPDGVATPKDSEVVDTEPDLEKPENTIVSIEKKGYRRNGRLLRLAEVVVVKN